MAIPDSDVAQVRAATDIVTLIGEYTPLKRVGRRHVGLCPFHAEKTGSFSVNGQEGLYYCFGCQASGDAIGFLRAIEGCDFVEALEKLASRAGISIRHEDGGRGQAERKEQKALKHAMERSVNAYHERLLTHPDASRARAYLRSRGYDGEVVRQFKLGWAPTSDTQDPFRGRVIFPIFDPTGTAIALGGRILPEVTPMPRDNRPQPKYRNSPESAIYSKRRTLYGLNWARQGIVADGEIVICEGYTDVIGLFVAGVPRAVATCGTALTDEHFRLIARFAKKVVLAFDADAAGQSAAARFYAWETRDEVSVTVAALPPGSDPGDLARTDPQQLKEAIGAAMPFLGWRVKHALDAGSFGSPEGRARAADAAVAMIAEHPDNALIRHQYLVEIADRTRIDVDTLKDRLEKGLYRAAAQPVRSGPVRGGPVRSGPVRGGTARGGTVRGGRSSAVDHGGDDGPPLQDAPDYDFDEWDVRPEGYGSRPGGGANGPASQNNDPSGRRTTTRAVAGERAGLDALGLAIHTPADMAPRLAACLFADALQRQAYETLAGATSLHEAIEGALEPVADLLTRLAVSEPAASADQTVVALVRTAVAGALRELEGDARRAQAEGKTDELLQVAATMAWAKSLLESLQDTGVGVTTAGSVTEATEALLGWLISRQGERA